MKEASVGDPDVDLGAKLKKTKLANGVTAWGMSPSKYVQEAVKDCEEYLNENYLRRFTLPKHGPTLFMMNYAPKMDIFQALNANDASCFQSLIGILH